LQGSAYAAYRGLAPPETATDDIGFRVARDLWRLP
jgi:formylglycine-generating enzyme required for sulfatase activity